MDLSQKTTAELQFILGVRLKAARIRAGLTQEEMAGRAQLSTLAISRLEAGKGSTVETLIRALKALGLQQAFDAIAPEPSVSPMAMLRDGGRRKTRVRVRKPRGSA